ncbi:MAG: histidinol-phosphatase HisJ family protein [Zetaproteobacteria bacterium]|nr:histidinol-phosphatase HisJ family protein [Zetaproteobacteria bacterium]
MHTPRCNHAIGSVVEYVQAAIDVGLKEIGISDHSPMPGGFDAAWRMDLQALPGYVTEVLQARERFQGQIEIKLGLEADFHPGTENAVRSMLAVHDWDYVIGSVHYLGDWGFDNPDELAKWDDVNVETAYVQYYEMVARSAELKMFDIIGHPDLIKKFGHRPQTLSSRVFAAEMAMLEAFRDAGVVMEVSSAGLRKPVNEVYPHARLIAQAAEMGVPISFGSDAHAPGEVGHAMQDCLLLFAGCGVKTIASFRKREMNLVALEVADAR